VVVCTAVLTFYIDTKHDLRGELLVKDAWIATAYLALPMIAIGWWEVWRGLAGHARPPRRGGSLLAAVGTFFVLAPVVGKIASGSLTRALQDDPIRLLGPELIGVVLLILGASRAGGDVRRWGMSLGDWRWWGPRVGVLAGLMVGMVILAVWAFPDFRSFYPQYKPARESFQMLLYYQASLGVYMIGWEFFYRGFLTHGLARRGDTLMALFFQAVPFYLLHRTKPDAEMLASFVGSLLIAWFCLRARSFLPAFLLHWGMNLSMESTAFVWRQFGQG